MRLRTYKGRSQNERGSETAVDAFRMAVSVSSVGEGDERGYAGEIAIILMDRAYRQSAGPEHDRRARINLTEEDAVAMMQSLRDGLARIATLRAEAEQGETGVKQRHTYVTLAQSAALTSFRGPANHGFKWGQ